LSKVTKYFMKPLLLSILFALFFMQTTAWANQEPRILIENDDYKLAKYEPRQGLYIGAYVLQDSLINYDMAKFNELTGKKHASFFRYVGYGQPFPEDWFRDLQEVGAVPHIAWEPNDGLDVVQDDTYLRTFARKLNESGVPVFLRFASEMNGDWTAYSGDPEKYIEKWRLVHDVMAEEAPNVMMVWTVFTFPQSTILTYYPGDEYVDWVGVNIYNVVYHNDSIRHRADHEDPLELLDYVYNTFSERKPIQISEYGATHFTITDNMEYVDFAIAKITRMYEGLKTRYPRVKSIFYFDVNNIVDGVANRQINNYALTDNEEILTTYAGLISNTHYLSDIRENEEGHYDQELFLVQEGICSNQGTTYISSHAVRKHFGAQVTFQSSPKQLVITKGAKTFVLPVGEKPEANAAFISNGTSYVPLRIVTSELGYKISWNGAENLILVTR
jgi:hypothetical protein